ncbi:MAG: N-6 DNA methylase [Candidatus Azobacteroides sp.]|nr:N-6 DNA methylase [Candidatus Azobacteroides sp.]
MMGSCNNIPEARILSDGLTKLGLESDKGKLLFFVKDRDSYANEPSIWFQLERAGLYHADAVFFKKGICENEYIPQIYIYDQTNLPLANPEQLTEIHKKVWTGGEVPLVCVFSKTEIKILDTTKPIEEPQKNVFKPVYLIENLKDIAKVHETFNEHFAPKIKSGTYWDNSNVDFIKNSSYSQLITLLRKVIDKFTKESGLENNKEFVQKLIIQCILVKYLEERRDESGNTVFPSSFFQKYDNSKHFSDVLKKGLVFDFFYDLNTNHFNGGIFKWDDNRKMLFNGKQNAFDYLAEVLRGYTDDSGQQLLEFEDNFSRLYAFNYIPVELISRLYEEFIIKENKKRKQELGDSDNSKNKNDGVAYTPSHLVKLLVDESMPLNSVPKNLDDFKVLDPACGSAIFLVVAFKRLVQWWRQKNYYKKPEIKDLMNLLSSVYGVDLDPKAVQISIFSLCIALCDELSPKEIWDNLKFNNLDGQTVFCKDFFDWKEEWLKKEDGQKFDIVIGNPPFVRGGLNKEQSTWIINNNAVEIPQNQIALKFLSESLSLLKDNGLSCLIVKSLPLLYSNSVVSKNYLKLLTQQFHVDQIFDFTLLARNGVLWDGVDVDSAAIFVTNAKPNYDRNILHAVFRRTKANKERIYFEIDKYDLHFILRNEVYEDSYIFKINLLGGGRIKNLIYKLLRIKNILESKDEYDIEIEEGFEIGTNGENDPDFLYEIPTLPSKHFKENGISIEYKDFPMIERTVKFNKPSKEIIFRHPNILIKENISLPMLLNDKFDFTYPRKIIGIASKKKEISYLSKLYDILIRNRDLYRFFIAATSAQVFVLKNSALIFEDIKRLPITDESFVLSSIEKNVITDVLEYTQYFIRRPETAEALKPLNNIIEEISFYGNEFSRAINEMYADDVNSFKLTDIINFEKENLIGTLFSYDERKNIIPQFITEKEVTQIDGLINFDINDSLTATRIIQYYAPNKVLFVKPNQKRYWLASIAYRDADSVFADILNNQ